MATDAQRLKLVEHARYLIAHEPQIDYSQERPYPKNLTWAQVVSLIRAGGHLRLDCSDSVTLLCKWAGLKDPNGLGYSGKGYTGTLREHLWAHRYFEAARAKAGALVLFGPGTGEHVCMVIEPHHSNPLLFSHGMTAGPIEIRLHDEAQFHNPPATFLAIASL